MKQLLAALIISLLLCISCKKEKITNCITNCLTLHVSGQVYDATTKTGLSNQPVSIKWYHRGFCLYCPALNVYKGTSGAKGFFNFSIIVDSTLFYNNDYLNLEVPINSNYILPEGILERRLYNSTDTDFQNIEFGLYPKATLTLRLRRSANDTFFNYNITHLYKPYNPIYDFFIHGPQFAQDTIIKVNTSANIYTKIASRKLISADSTEIKEDSIMCTKSGTNVFDINY